MTQLAQAAPADTDHTAEIAALNDAARAGSLVTSKTVFTRALAEILAGEDPDPGTRQLNLMIGQLTPPSGVVTFLTAQIAGAPLEKVFREAWPFTVALVAVLALVTFIPALALWLPDLLMGK